MTFTIKIRGVADRPIVAEYHCPVHGRFTLEVARDTNGDAPAVKTSPGEMDVVRDAKRKK